MSRLLACDHEDAGELVDVAREVAALLPPATSAPDAQHPLLRGVRSVLRAVLDALLREARRPRTRHRGPRRAPAERM